MTDRFERASVVIVGCGPGGAVLAYLLARSGVDVALVERESTFEREYRGFGWNPGVVRLFDEMDVLNEVLDLAHETVREGEFSIYGETVSVMDFDLLETEYPYALMMEQPALLECLVDQARQYDGFEFYPGTTVTGLKREPDGENYTDEGNDGPIVGITARDRSTAENVVFEGQCVVGADGRYSVVRSSAGIDPGLFDSPIDLVWFKLPDGAVQVPSEGQIDRTGILVSFGLGGGDLQVGLIIEAETWPAIKDAGFETFRDRVAAIDPQFGPAIDEHLDGFVDTTLLDVAPGIAATWSEDGLLLLGDAAHVASPIGAQGNPLAVEDAVVAHDVLCTALESESEGSGGPGPLPDAAIGSFEDRRRPTVESVIALQRRAADNLAFWLQYGQYVPPVLVRGSMTVFGWLVPRSRWVRGLVESFALGDQSVTVARDHFED